MAEPEQSGRLDCPCGCAFWNEGGPTGAFVIDPCGDPNCEIFLEVMTETAKLGKEVLTRER